MVKKLLVAIIMVISIFTSNIPVKALENSEPITTLSCQYAVAIDAKSGLVLYNKNMDERMYPASMTKVMTVIVALEMMKDTSTTTVITQSDIDTVWETGAYSANFEVGEVVTYEDLLYGAILPSGADATRALANNLCGSQEAFVAIMNELAGELGLKDTHFVTPHGLDEDEHYTTAYELAKIADYALNIEEIAKIVKTKVYTININGYSKNIKNTNELLGYLEGVYGVKTGFTNGANRCLVTSVKRGEMNVICVVLGADTKKDRTQDSIKLIEYSFSNYQMVDLKFMIEDEFDTLVDKAKFSIVKGINNNLTIDLEEFDITLYPVHKEDIKDIKIETELRENLIAPVYKNDKIRKSYIKNRR